MAVEPPITEAEVVEENLAEIVTEPVVDETAPVEGAAEEVTEPIEEVTEPAVEEEATVEETATTEESAPTTTLDITIGSAVIHVNDKTSPELLSKTVQSLVSAMQTK